jgi:hypothetical protein
MGYLFSFVTFAGFMSRCVVMCVIVVSLVRGLPCLGSMADGVPMTVGSETRSSGVLIVLIVLGVCQGAQPVGRMFEGVEVKPHLPKSGSTLFGGLLVDRAAERVA